MEVFLCQAGEVDEAEKDARGTGKHKGHLDSAAGARQGCSGGHVPSAADIRLCVEEDPGTTVEASGGGGTGVQHGRWAEGGGRQYGFGFEFGN